MSIASRLGWYRVRGNRFRQFELLLEQVLRSLKGQQVILDGEIVVLDEKGRSNLRSHGPSWRASPWRF
jgi:hypothetical protein